MPTECSSKAFPAAASFRVSFIHSDSVTTCPTGDGTQALPEPGTEVPPSIPENVPGLRRMTFII